MQGSVWCAWGMPGAPTTACARPALARGGSRRTARASGAFGGWRRRRSGRGVSGDPGVPGTGDAAKEWHQFMFREVPVGDRPAMQDAGDAASSGRPGHVWLQARRDVGQAAQSRCVSKGKIRAPPFRGWRVAAANPRFSSGRDPITSRPRGSARLLKMRR